MRSNRINYIVVGTFVILGVAALIVTIALLAGRTGPRDGYFTVYDNVSGVRAGTQVRFEGYPVGQVTEVEPVIEDSRLRFRIAFAVERGFPIPEDSRAVIASAGLLAGSSIEIERGTARQTLTPGTMIAAGPTADPFSALARLAGQMDELNIEAVQPMMETVMLYIDAVGETLLESTPRLLNDLETFTDSLRQSAPEMAGEIEHFLQRLNNDLLGERNLRNIDRTLQNLERSSEALNEDVLAVENRDRLRSLLGNFESSSEDFAALAAELRRSEETVERILAGLDEMVEDSRAPVGQSVADLQYTLENVSQNIDSITRNLEGASRNMNEFSRQIRQNPGLLLRGRGTGVE